MREFVGVKPFVDFVFSRNLKREALIFNRIAIPEFNKHFNRVKLTPPTHTVPPFASPSFLNELEWLYEEGVIFEVEDKPLSKAMSDEEYANVISSENEIHEQLKQLNSLPSRVTIEPEDFFKDVERTFRAFRPVALQLAAEAFRARRLSLRLQKISHVDAYSISFLNSLTTSQNQARKSNVVKITLKALPVPDDSVTWEQVYEYRSDANSQSKFLALRNWMGEVARTELTPAEVEEKLEYLIDQYRQHLKLHRMKTNVGTLETIVTTGAEVLGDLVSFRWGKAAQALFSFKRRQVALLEGELVAPGREVAYIVNAREAFGG